MGPEIGSFLSPEEQERSQFESDKMALAKLWRQLALIENNINRVLKPVFSSYLVPVEKVIRPAISEFRPSGQKNFSA